MRLVDATDPFRSNDPTTTQPAPGRAPQLPIQSQEPACIPAGGRKTHI